MGRAGKQRFVIAEIKPNLLEEFMKKNLNSLFILMLVLTIASLMFSCASGPKLGQPTVLQSLLNDLPEVSIAGKRVQFEFGGDIWISKVDGKEYLAGTFKSEDNTGGSTLTLKQTHIFSTNQKPGVGGEVGWVKTPGPDIILEYKKGPPASLTAK
jgi:hypothetical protein